MIGRREQGRLVARKLTDYTLSLYAARTYLDDTSRPTTPGELGQHRLIGYVEDLIYAPTLNYTQEFYRHWMSAIEISSATGQLQAVRSGAGIGALHDYLARDHEELELVLPGEQITRTYWIVVHESLRDTARIHAVTDFLVEQVRLAGMEFVRAA